MRHFLFLASTLVSIGAWISRAAADDARPVIEIDADTLEDKIRGGMLAQIIGNLNGLPHEFKYIDKPGNVDHYTPALPGGAHTDDDTDIEWVYLREIARSRECFLPPERIAALWKQHINRRIFCANRYARDLMDLGLEPPWTGNLALNPWSEFNISGQFICESFGLMAPAMPQTAARLGLNYTHVAINGEPAQATQLFTAMIATAFVETDLDRIIDAGLAAVDPKSEIHDVVRTTRKLCREHPHDWRAARAEFKTRWQTHGGGIRDRNGYELNTACVIAALVYGNRDFVETLRTAFNLGWDADCDAATAATIVGVIKGRRWMNDQGWNIKDVYRNTTRDDMPTDETITGLENTLIAAARIVIEHHRGELVSKLSPSGSAQTNPERSPSGRGQGEGALKIYRIRTERPANVEPLATPADQVTRLRQHFEPQLERDLTVQGASRARAAYLAICLGDAERLKHQSPTAWSAAIAELEKHPAVINDIFHAPAPGDDELRRNAQRAGLQPPPAK
jgi:ADP-ribosylglycohydrolase